MKAKYVNMLIYSHLIVASVMEPYIKLLQVEEYYLGSIAPDIRYYAGIPRNQTHIPLDKIASFANQYPHLTSFVLGYLIHCASENLPRDTGLTETVFNQFPFSMKTIQRKLPKSFVSVLLALYHLENHQIHSRISEAGNEMLRELGIDDNVVGDFAGKFNRFLEQPSLESGMVALQDLGLLGNEGVNRYIRAARIAQIGIVKRWLFSVIREPVEEFHQKSISILLETCKPLIQDFRS